MVAQNGQNRHWLYRAPSVFYNEVAAWPEDEGEEVSVVAGDG